MKTPVTIYTTPFCPYCIRAKRLLSNKGVDFTEISIYDVSGEDRKALAQKTNNYRTVPQIFIGDRFIGGSDELAKLERENQLEALLNG
ncbi:glutaredoxin 3 [Moraxella macacae 0408225]|uniref:Glutaredoxin n=1 Tax=Moraxella macacae 0408225 TaxID=1230338 RepID=L2F6G0_9GAMM|nr:glutaredoxin 3 [Moraxella macacae]ELA08500.1 glutaredoxin 3 [Moraxella macacae 0408225]